MCDSVCACASNSESVCVCVHVLSIKHDLHIHYSQRVLCVVCMQARLSLCILELSFRLGMHVHSSLLRVCVRGCVRVRAVRTENACVCVPMCLSSNMINMIGKRVLDHVLRVRVPNNIYGADFLCMFLLKASSRPV